VTKPRQFFSTGPNYSAIYKPGIILYMPEVLAKARRIAMECNAEFIELNDRKRLKKAETAVQATRYALVEARRRAAGAPSSSSASSMAIDEAGASAAGVHGAAAGSNAETTAAVDGSGAAGASSSSSDLAPSGSSSTAAASSGAGAAGGSVAASGSTAGSADPTAGPQSVEEAEAAAKAAQAELDAAKAAAESHYRHNMREAVQRVTLFKDVSDINERLAAAGGSAEEVAYVRECAVRFVLCRAWALAGGAVGAGAA